MTVGFFKARPPNGKPMSTSLAIVYKLVWNHPFLVFMVLILIYLHWHFPLLFSLLVSASPVLVCTAFLLATLLIHGQPNDHKARERNYVSETASSPREKDGYCKDRFAEVRKDIVEKGMKAYFAEFEDNEAQMHKFQPESIDEITRVQEHGTTTSTDIDSDEAEEGSFLDALVGEGTPTHQEIRPLLYFDNHPQHPDTSHSRSVSPKSEEDEVVGSENDDDDEDEDDNVEKCEGEPVTMWTEEDEKNLRYLGSCELERNQCLENMIAKRRKQRNFPMISERNFQVAHIVTATGHKVDSISSPFDVVNSSTSPSSAPSTTFPRKNPFDSPCISPKSGAHNPFDVPHNAKDHVLRRYESFNPHYNFMEDVSDTRPTFSNLFTLDKPTQGFHMSYGFDVHVKPEPKVTPMHLQDPEEEGKVDHHLDPSSSSSTTSKVDDKDDKEPNLLPKSSVEESNFNNESNDEDQNKDPVYDTSPSGVRKNRSFSPASEM